MNDHNSCQVVVGRLLEVRIHGLEEPQGVTAFADSVKAALESMARSAPGRRVVLVADWRRCPLLKPPVAEAVGEMFRRNSPLIERNALLRASDQSTSALQLFRIALEAENPHRRVFTQVQELQSWVDELLDDAERARLRSFLGEPL